MFVKFVLLLNVRIWITSISIQFLFTDILKLKDKGGTRAAHPHEHPVLKGSTST